MLDIFIYFSTVLPGNCDPQTVISINAPFKIHFAIKEFLC